MTRIAMIMHVHLFEQAYCNKACYCENYFSPLIHLAHTPELGLGLLGQSVAFTHCSFGCESAAMAQDINLRELTKKYGRGIGLNIGAVRAYAAQLLTALYHLRNCGVIHADIKARPALPFLTCSSHLSPPASWRECMPKHDYALAPCASCDHA